MQVQSGYPQFYRYGSIELARTNNKLHVPVKWVDSPYASLRHIVGYPALRRDQGIDIKALNALDNRIASLAKVNQKTQELLKEPDPSIRQYKNAKLDPQTASISLFSGKDIPNNQFLDFAV